MRASSARLVVWSLTSILALVVAGLCPVVPARGLWISLTGLLPAYTSVAHDLEFSPDSQHVVFVADVASDEQDELYSVPISGGGPVRLNSALVSGGDVQSFAVTPDSQYVLYVADQDVDERADLYRVPISGGAVVKLNGVLPAGGNVVEVQVDPDNVYVVYVADGEVNDMYELYSVPVAGGAPFRLSPAPVSGGNVVGFKIDRIANRVVFRGDLEANNRFEVFSAPIAGGASIKLSPPGASGTRFFELDPSLQVVVFSATPNGSTSTHLYMNATTGGLLTTLNTALASNQDVSGFKISPDGARVVYNVTTMTSTLFVTSGNLHSVLIGGGTSTQLTNAVAGYGVFGALFEITSDNQRVVYGYQANATAPTILRSVPILGGSPTTLFTSESGDLLSLRAVSPDGQWVVFNTWPSYTIRAVAIAGGSPVWLGRSPNYLITPDSARVLMMPDSISGDVDLLSTQIFGGDLRNLSRVDSGMHTGRAAISPDGQSIAYVVSHMGSSRGLEIRLSDGGEAQWVVYLPGLLR